MRANLPDPKDCIGTYTSEQDFMLRPSASADCRPGRPPDATSSAFAPPAPRR